ncbi:hypothetical protein Poli38472_007099 [Pythium oligandrum]|uniref:Anoctamin transmembrane domain-containing protein n=1 Tax=Pythium oligandrum TaxID=41045 RepID=A0A8K1C9I4_PYTOL|nr:hypothetical protein Poli38472_007099 [Pythium oligandrum]|eukprot:TMW58954.1 hypothetical protein Poli38472_007099 [Pythium oligandrum]
MDSFLRRRGRLQPPEPRPGIQRHVKTAARAPTLMQRVVRTTIERNVAAFSKDTESITRHPDADYCLYVELVEPEENQSWGELEAHQIVDTVVMLLKDQGCDIQVFPLEHVDSEVLATSKDVTRAYYVTICSAGMRETGLTGALSARPIPEWVKRQAAYKLVTPLTGAAHSQQLTRLILQEYRLLDDICLRDNKKIFAGGQRLFCELGHHKDKLDFDIFPLHREVERNRLISKWRVHLFDKLPLVDIFAYFGPKLAMYLAWLEFYTEMLVLPAVLGVMVSILGFFQAESYCLLSFLISIGTSVFADFWRRRQRLVEYTWKYQQLMESEAVVDLETRPEFQGEWVIDHVTEQRVYDFPRHKRFFRQLLAIPLLLSMCCVVGGYVVLLNLLSEHLRSVYPVCFRKHKNIDAIEKVGMSLGQCTTAAHGPGVLNAISIMVLDKIYHRLAKRLNEFENYRTTAEFDEHLVMKRIPFNIINSNASLWYFAFYMRDLDRVRDRLWILMVMMQFLDNLKEIGLPFVVSLYARFLATDKHHQQRTEGQTLVSESISERIQRLRTQQRQVHYVDTFADYKEMMVQYGYVALYTPIFPLAPFFAWLNNVVESRSDFLKLVNSNGFQRPIVKHTHGIGVWERILVALSVIAVIINCALVWTFEIKELVPSWSELHQFMLLIACEHLVFIIKGLLNWAAPDLPTWIQNEKRIAALSSTRAQLLSPTRAQTKELLHY